METDIIRLGVMTILAGLSGLFLLGFVLYSIFSVVMWRLGKARLYQLWGALLGIVVNGVVFWLTFPVAYPGLMDIFERAFRRFL